MHYSSYVSRMNFENGGASGVKNENEQRSEAENIKYEEYVRLREDAPSAVVRELEAILGGTIESVGPRDACEAAQKLFDQYAADAEGEGNVNRMKAKVASRIVEKLTPLVKALDEIEKLRIQYPEIPLPSVFANDNSAESKIAA